MPLGGSHLEGGSKTSSWIDFCCSVTKLCPTLCNPVDCGTPGFSVLHYLPEFAHTQWYHPTMSASVTLFSSCPQSFTASGSFPVSCLFASGGQCIRASVSASVLPMNIHGWFPLGLFGLIYLHSMGLSRVFSNTTIWKNQFFGTEPSSWSNSHIHTWPLEKP